MNFGAKIDKLGLTVSKRLVEQLGGEIKISTLSKEHLKDYVWKNHAGLKLKEKMALMESQVLVVNAKMKSFENHLAVEDFKLRNSQLQKS